MASVNTPTGSEVRVLTGFNTYIRGDASNNALDSWLSSSIIPRAVNRVKLKVGEATYALATHTEAQADAIATAIAWVAAAMALISPELQKVTGSHSPLLMESAEDIRDARDALMDEADDWIGLATAGTENRPVRKPRFRSSTFTVSTTDRTPGERLDLQDEMDDVSAWDVDNG